MKNPVVARRKITYVCLLGLALICLPACDKDEVAVEMRVDEEGLTRDIRAFLPDSLYDAMVALGMPINGGAAPPDPEGDFFAEDIRVRASTTGANELGRSAGTYAVTLSEQVDEALEIDVRFTNNQMSAQDLGGFIVGEGDKFSIFMQTTAFDALYQDSAEFVQVLCGQMTTEGIDSFAIGAFMSDNRGNPNGHWIPNNTGRVLAESDGLAERQE